MDIQATLIWKEDEAGELFSLRPEPGKKTSVTSTARGQSGSPTTENESIWGGASILENLDWGLGSHPGWLEMQRSRGRHRVRAKISLAHCTPSLGTSILVRDKGIPRRSKVKPANGHCSYSGQTQEPAQGALW